MDHACRRQKVLKLIPGMEKFDDTAHHMLL
jgi:hypothetical protein